MCDKGVSAEANSSQGPGFQQLLHVVQCNDEARAEFGILCDFSSLERIRVPTSLGQKRIAAYSIALHKRAQWQLSSRMWGPMLYGPTILIQSATQMLKSKGHETTGSS